MYTTFINQENKIFAGNKFLSNNQVQLFVLKLDYLYGKHIPIHIYKSNENRS